MADVSEAAVQAALDAVAPFWKEAHAVLQAYPSAALARAMLEGAAPLIRAEAEAQLAEIRSVLLEGGQGDATARCRAIAIIGTGEENRG